MLVVHLHNAGFFPISWTPTASASDSELGTTFVRASAHGVLRVFVPDAADEVEVYTGRLAAGELCYRGPVRTEDELRQVLAGAARPRRGRHTPHLTRLACAA